MIYCTQHILNSHIVPSEFVYFKTILGKDKLITSTPILGSGQFLFSICHIMKCFIRSRPGLNDLLHPAQIVLFCIRYFLWIMYVWTTWSLSLVNFRLSSRLSFIWDVATFLLAINKSKSLSIQLKYFEPIFISSLHCLTSKAFLFLSSQIWGE